MKIILTKDEKKWLELNALNSQSVQLIRKGGNNALYKILSTKGGQYLLKRYLNDDNQRLVHERQVLKLLLDNGIENVPKPIISNMGLKLGVYTFINGRAIAAKTLQEKDIDQIIGFMSKIQSINIDSSSEYILKAPYFRKSYSDYLRAIQVRLDTIKGNSPIINRVKVEMRVLRQKYINLDFDEEFAPKDIRLSQVDWGIHNLIANNSDLYFVDFEYAGLDHILKAPADFLCHDSLQPASKKIKRYFYNKYVKVNKLTRPQVEKLNLSIRLINLEWIGIYLQSIDQDKIQTKIAAGKLNEQGVDDYINKKISAINNRLKGECLSYVNN